jgi:hypothetical protein
VLYDYTTFYAFLIILIFFIFFLSAIFYVWASIALMGVFKKANHPQPWAAWIPFYRDYVFFEVGGQSGWFMFLTLASGIVLSFTEDEFGVRWVITLLVSILVSAAAAVFWVFAIVNVNKAFGKHVLGFTILGVLLPLIWLSILAWDRSQFVAKRANGPMVPGHGNTFLEQSSRSSEPESETTNIPPASAPTSASTTVAESDSQERD